MKQSIFALAGTLLVAGVLAGCGETPATTGTTPSAQPSQGGGLSPAAGGNQSTAAPAISGAPGGVKNSWDVIKDRTKYQLVASATQGVVKPVKDGASPLGGLRGDPFESMIKVVEPEIPAFSLVLPRRLASAYRQPAPQIEGDPNQYRGPLPPVARRVAGVMYNGAITAILETGDASGSVRHDVIRPGSVVPFGIDGLPDLTVESITMSTLILRAPDGRTVEVKLSGLPPAVADSLRQQFGNGGGVGGGMPGGGPGLGAGAGAGGDKGGGGVRDF